MAFPAGNPSGHHDDFLAGKLRILTEPAVQPLLAKFTLVERIHIDTTLNNRQLLRRNGVVVHHVVPHTLGHSNDVIGAGHDGAVGCYRIHAVECGHNRRAFPFRDAFQSQEDNPGGHARADMNDVRLQFKKQFSHRQDLPEGRRIFPVNRHENML